MIKKGTFDEDVAKYVPGLKKLAYPGMAYGIKTEKSPEDPAYKDLQNPECHFLLPANHCTDLNSMYLCFPIKLSNSTDPAQGRRADVITVNTFLLTS